MFYVPATHVSYADAAKIMVLHELHELAHSDINLLSMELPLQMFMLPVYVASFSSRGPNQASPGILKPDIIGLGVNILAA